MVKNNNYLLEFLDVSHSFKQAEIAVDVLNKINFRIPKGSIVGLLGTSGSGKSTLLQLAGLLEKPERGKIIINSKSTDNLSDGERTLLRRNNIGFVFQKSHLLAEFSALENLTIAQKGNTLVLYSRVETHGLPLYEMINKSKETNRKCFFVFGGVAAEEREQVREITEVEENAIIIASYGTFSTGINIKRLHNIIFASPSKSRIRNLQSIGRVLRKGDKKVKATLYDIADDITHNSSKNYTLNHLMERVKIYNEENFNYEIITIPLKQ